MPELPEVETVVRDLRELLLGRTFTRIEVGPKSLRRKSSRGWQAHMPGKKVHGIQRRGKWILLDIGKPWMLIHLGMTGQFTVTSAHQPREAHTHIVWTLDNEAELRFRDIRRFGSVTFYPTRGHLDAFFQENGLGPEPFDIDAQSWHVALRTRKRNLKALLLDQTIVAGVGNIYADETLFEARLHPAILGENLTLKQAEALRQAMVKVLDRAIEQRGSSIRNYVGGSGLKGAFQDEFCAYGRTGKPCPRCGAAIRKVTLAGRSTHFCPKCQRKRV